MNPNLVTINLQFFLYVLVSSLQYPGKIVRENRLQEVLKILETKVIFENQRELSGMAGTLQSLRELAETIRSEKLPRRPVVEGLDYFFEESQSFSNLSRFSTDAHFYRILARSCDYFEQGFDPFVKEKVKHLQDSMGFIEQLTSRIPDLYDESPLLSLESGIQLLLWADHLDIDGRPPLSSEGKQSKKPPLHTLIFSKKPYTVVDQSNELLNHLHSMINKSHSNKPRTVNILVGEIGSELISSLFFCTMLLQLNVCDRVRLLTKPYPLDVLQCTTRDVVGTIQYMCDPENSDVWSVRHFGDSLRSALVTGKIIIAEDQLTPLPVEPWALPSALFTTLQDSDLILSIGDWNYRWILGDLQWEPQTDPRVVLSYWNPTPICVVNRLRSGICVGVEELRQTSISDMDRHWMSSGDWSVIHFIAANEP